MGNTIPSCRHIARNGRADLTAGAQLLSAAISIQ
jgi:hypothetical protein